MADLNLKLNHTYLLQFGSSDTIFSVTVLGITDKAYYLRWNGSKGNNDIWDLKNKISRNYNIVEDISDFNIPQSNISELESDSYNVRTELIPCHICHGMGTIPDTESSAIQKTCPACFGNKLVPKVTEISY